MAEDLTNNSRMPFNNGNGTNADNYITKVEGSFKLAADANGNGTSGEMIDVTFGVFCEDGASLRVVGQESTSAKTFSGRSISAR